MSVELSIVILSIVTIVNFSIPLYVYIDRYNRRNSVK
jgi:hypothetical protein